MLLQQKMYNLYSYVSYIRTYIFYSPV